MQRLKEKKIQIIYNKMYRLYHNDNNHLAIMIPSLLYLIILLKYDLSKLEIQLQYLVSFSISYLNTFTTSYYF